MQLYPVPYLPRGEDKIVAGRLSLRQAAWLVAGGFLGLALMRSGAGWGAALPALLGCALAFGEVPPYGTALDRFLWHLLRYEAAPVFYPYRRRGGDAAVRLAGLLGVMARWLRF
ncbi:MAG: hypothetical protein AB1816_15515 [Bacillota bacterium]